MKRIELFHVPVVKCVECGALIVGGEKLVNSCINSIKNNGSDWLCICDHCGDSFSVSFDFLERD